MPGQLKRSVSSKISFCVYTGFNLTVLYTSRKRLIFSDEKILLKNHKWRWDLLARHAMTQILTCRNSPSWTKKWNQFTQVLNKNPRCNRNHSKLWFRKSHNRKSWKPHMVRKLIKSVDACGPAFPTCDCQIFASSMSQHPNPCPSRWSRNPNHRRRRYRWTQVLDTIRHYPRLPHRAGCCWNLCCPRYYYAHCKAELRPRRCRRSSEVPSALRNHQMDSSPFDFRFHPRRLLQNHRS